MKKFQQRVMTVRKSDNIVNVLRRALNIAEGKFSLIHIEDSLIDRNIFKKEKLFNSEGVYEADVDDYKIIVHNSGDWWELYYLYLLKSRNAYTMFNNFLDYDKGFVEGIDIYIRRWGSETKIDEG